MKKASELLAIVKEVEKREEVERMAKIKKYVSDLLVRAEERAKDGWYYIFDDLSCGKEAIIMLQSLGYTVETTKINSFRISWYE